MNYNSSFFKLNDKPNKVYLFGLFALIIVHLPYVILGENSFITIHDNLDSEFIYLHLLKESGNLFSFNGGIVPNIFNGLDRNYFHSEFSFIRVLFYFLPPFWAYVVNSLIVRLIGFLGVFLLIKDYFKSTKPNFFLTFLVSFSFSLLPVYLLYGISILGQPLLLWAFLNLKNNKKIKISLLVIIGFPFYSHFAMTAPFIVSALLLLGLYLLIFRQEKVNKYFWVGIILIIGFYLIANYNSIAGFFNEKIPSHRSEWAKSLPSLNDFKRTFYETLKNGQYHSSRFYGLPFIVLVIFSVIKRSEYWKSILKIFVLILLIITFYSCYSFLSVPLESKFHILTSFQFHRFTFLIPTLFFVIVLFAILDRKIPRVFILVVILSFSFLTLRYNYEITVNLRTIVLRNTKDVFPSFRTFFSEGIFLEVKKHIGRPTNEYRIVNIGFHPSIAQFNGFYTLDSYQNNYPLDYKHQFRKIIENELEKDEKLKAYFDNWGNRCYLFSAELFNSCRLDCRKDVGIEIENLDINIDKLRDLGGQYILSAVPIKNIDQLEIIFEKSFRDSVSNLEIYLYKI